MKENFTILPTFKRNMNLTDLLFECIKKWYVIAITIFVVISITLVYTVFFQTPMYTSTSKIMIFNKEETTALADLELSSSIYLARDFTEIINDKFVLDDVADELDNKYSVTRLKTFISINNPQNTRILEIIVTSTNAKDSKKIADSICDISQSKLVELMGLDRITTISYGNLPRTQSSPNIYNNLAIAFFIGAILSLCIIVVLFTIDNKISSVQDVEKYIGLSVLATIPYNNAKNENQS